MGKRRQIKAHMEQTRIHIVRLREWSKTFHFQNAITQEDNLHEAVKAFKKQFKLHFCGEEGWLPCPLRRIEEKNKALDAKLKDATNRINEGEKKIEELKRRLEHHDDPGPTGERDPSLGNIGSTKSKNPGVLEITGTPRPYSSRRYHIDSRSE